VPGDTGGSVIVPAVATRPTRPQDTPSRPAGNGGSNPPDNPGTPPGTPPTQPTQPPANARTHVLSVGAAVAPGKPLLSLGTTSNLVRSLTRLELADVHVDLSGLLPGTKIDLDLLR
jgi:hypothetical protein